MAFDLNTFLQTNKKFLAGALLGTGVFFVGHVIIDSVFGNDLVTSRREVASVKSKMTNNSYFSAKNLEEAKAQQKVLDETLQSLTQKLAFTSRAQFQLKDGGASPSNQYLGIAAEFRERRLDDARSRGVDLVDNVGIPDRSPTEPEDIRRTLRALDLVDRILGFALVPGTRAIDRIQIVSDREAAVRTDRWLREDIRVEFEMSLTSEALTSILEGTQAMTPPLTIVTFDATTIGTAGGRGDGFVRLLVTFAALDVAAPKE
jgi:hypothetical protein